MEKKERWPNIGFWGHKEHTVRASKLTSSRRPITRDEAIIMVGDEIMGKFDQELEDARGRLQKVGRCEYYVEVGRAYVGVDLTNSYVYNGSYELSEDGLLYLKARVNDAADDAIHEGNDEFGI